MCRGFAGVGSEGREVESQRMTGKPEVPLLKPFVLKSLGSCFPRLIYPMRA